MKLLPAALSLAFAAALSLSAAAASAATPIVTFASGGSVTASGPLVAGQPAILRYDTTRQPLCRATYNGLPAWAITAGFHGDDSSNVTTVTVNDGSIPTDVVDVPITVPYGPDFSVWFHASDDHGCSTWDSNFSQNFHFAVQGPPTIHFKTGWTESVAGTLHAGQTIAVDYDLTRLATCRSTSDAFQAWDVSVHYRFDGGPVSNATVTQVVGTYGHGPMIALLAAPAGAHTVEMWFENTDVHGCDAWDSKYGQNYRFSLQ